MLAQSLMLFHFVCSFYSHVFFVTLLMLKIFSYFTFCYVTTSHVQRKDILFTINRHSTPMGGVQQCRYTFIPTVFDLREEVTSFSLQCVFRCTVKNHIQYVITAQCAKLS